MPSVRVSFVYLRVFKYLLISLFSHFSVCYSNITLNRVSTLISFRYLYELLIRKSNGEGKRHYKGENFLFIQKLYYKSSLLKPY